MRYTLYIVSTILYGICAILGLIAIIYFVIKSQYFLAFLGLLFFYVSIDNFFCGKRARACGKHIIGHYALPPFLKLKRDSQESSIKNKKTLRFAEANEIKKYKSPRGY